MPVPFERSYWVLPGELLAGYYPGDKSPIRAEQKLRSLLESGIRCFIDLTGEGDVDHSGKTMIPYQAELARLAGSMGLTVSYKCIPVPDAGIPTRSVMRRILNRIDRALGQNLPVYVHCWGGRGRTGTVIGCYLARKGIAVGADALRKINELRHDVPDAHLPSPENERQCQFVHSWRIGD